MPESLSQKIQDAETTLQLHPEGQSWRRTTPHTFRDLLQINQSHQGPKTTMTPRDRCRPQGTQCHRPSCLDSPKGARAFRPKASRPADLSARSAQPAHPEGRSNIAGPSSRPKKFLNAWYCRSWHRPKDVAANTATALRTPLRTQCPPCVPSIALRRARSRELEASSEPSE